MSHTTLPLLLLQLNQSYFLFGDPMMFDVFKIHPRFLILSLHLAASILGYLKVAYLQVTGSSVLFLALIPVDIFQSSLCINCFVKLSQEKSNKYHPKVEPLCSITPALFLCSGWVLKWLTTSGCWSPSLEYMLICIRSGRDLSMHPCLMQIFLPLHFMLLRLTTNGTNQASREAELLISGSFPRSPHGLTPKRQQRRILVRCSN